MFNTFKEAFLNVLTLEFFNFNFNGNIEDTQTKKLITTTPTPPIIESKWYETIGSQLWTLLTVLYYNRLEIIITMFLISLWYLIYINKSEDQLKLLPRITTIRHQIKHYYQPHLTIQ